jgi:hypothetical protein
MTVLALGAIPACDTAIRLGNMGPPVAPPSRSGDEARCAYTAFTVDDPNARLSAVSVTVARAWLADAASGLDAPCPVRIARVSPEFSEGEGIPTLEEARGALRALVAPGVLPWELSQDGSQQVAHAIARSLASRGFNAHKLFAIGRLNPRDVDERFLRRGGLFSDRRTTSDPSEAQRWSYHPAAVIVVRVDGREGQSFPCADDRARRCAWRVLDPAIRLGRAAATTDDALGLLTVSRWLRALRPADEGSSVGISLELARRGQVLPRSVHASAFDPVVVSDGDGCALDPDGVRERAATRRAGRGSVVTASYRAIVSIEADAGPGGSLQLEGIDVPITVPDRVTLDRLRFARDASALVTVSYDGETATLRAWRPERGMAPTPCLRATLVLGDQAE